MFGKRMLDEHKQWNTDSYLSTTSSSYYSVVICGGTSLPRAGSVSKSFQAVGWQGQGEVKVYLSLLDLDCFQL